MNSPRKENIRSSGEPLEETPRSEIVNPNTPEGRAIIETRGKARQDMCDIVDCEAQGISKFPLR